MWLIVGLGNPGRKYERNRHNVGFFVVDELARRHSLGPFKERLGGLTASGLIGLDKVILLKPMEYMNHSGFPLQRVAQYHGVEPDKIVVIHDELDLDVGRLKLKAGGGHGGHNGLRSIVQQLGSKDFLRVRIGIGRPGGTSGAGDRDRRVSGYVLSDVPAAERPAIEQAVEQASDAVETILDRGITAAMNQFNTRGESDAVEAS